MVSLAFLMFMDILEGCLMFDHNLHTPVAPFPLLWLRWIDPYGTLNIFPTVFRFVGFHAVCFTSTTVKSKGCTSAGPEPILAFD